MNSRTIGPNPQASEADLAATLPDTLGALWRYIKSWQTQEGRFAGIIATWWASTAQTAVPHPMSDPGIMLGLLRLHRAGMGGADWLAEARRIGDGLCGDTGPDGEIKDAWGDVPGKSTGPIHHVAPAEALAELFAETGEGKYIDGCLRILRMVDGRWVRGFRLFHTVVNQELRWGKAMLAASRPTNDETLRFRAYQVARAVLVDRVSRGKDCVAFHQGARDDKLISVYVGKCLNPLLDLAEDDFAEDAARALGASLGRPFDPDQARAEFRRTLFDVARYLMSVRAEHGIFRNYEVSQPMWKGWRYGEALAQRLWGSTRPITDWRRASIRGWLSFDYPSFVARASDSIRAFWRIADLDGQFRQPAAEMTRDLLAGQLPHGGVRNAFGWFGNPDETHWQDICCPIRWNSYAFELLCDLAARHNIAAVNVPDGPIPTLECEVGPRQSGLLQENEDTVRLTHEGKPRFVIHKKTGDTSEVEPELAGLASAYRAMR